MYDINDLIMYGGTGVCKISDISNNVFSGSSEDRLYYVLEPLYQSGVIYAPVDNEKVFMRPVISEDEAKDLIDNIPQIHTEIYKSSSMQQLTKYYQSVIDSHKCLELLQLTKIHPCQKGGRHETEPAFGTNRQEVYEESGRPFYLENLPQHFAFRETMWKALYRND